MKFKEKYDKNEDIDRILHPAIRDWFYSRFKEYSLPQLYAVREIHSRKNILVSAPTGATKTLTGFLSILNELVDNALKGQLEDRIYCVYISPLKALNYDIEVNLLRPLSEIEEQLGRKLGIRVGVRTGDTTASERSRMARKPPHILITTPESLGIILASRKFRENLRRTEWMIVDEIHALASSKRGVHLSLTLEMLQHLSGYMTRIGLSATVAPLEDVARYLVGQEGGKDRECIIVDVQFIKQLDLKVLSPVPDLINVSHHEMHRKMYELIDNLIQGHKTTLIFTNTRAATERVVHHLKDRFPKNYSENIGAHHGSLSKTHRHSIEDRLRKGKLKAVVCSTSLELGIDIGYIDLVILLGSPKSVSRALQRVGRSGHQLHSVTKGRIIVLDRDDLVECSVLLKNAIEKKIDRIHIPTNCLDVLGQQIYSILIQDRMVSSDLFRLIRQSYCYKTLSRTDFDSVIEYLAGKYVSLEDRNVYAKIWHDPETGMLGRKGKLARLIYMTNIGTIPDESYVTVKIGEQPVGRIDEGFLEKLKRGDIFVLGGDTYEFLYSRGMSAQVKSSSGRPPTVPSWVSEMLPLSFDLARDIGSFRRLMEEKLSTRSKKEVLDFIDSYLYVDRNGSEAIYNYFHEQHSYGLIPNDKRIVIEHIKTEGKKQIIFHSLFGRRVNDVLSRAIAFAISKTQHSDVEIGLNDNGFSLSTRKSVKAAFAVKIIHADRLRQILGVALDKTEVLKRRFRHCAARALMILRSYKGRTKNVGKQQVSSMLLLSAVRRISPDFPILKEAKREVLEDLMDIDSAKKIVQEMEKGEIKLKEIHTDVPSPFAFNIALQGISDILKIEDRHEFLKRMHQLVISRIGGEEAGDIDSLRRDLAEEMQARAPSEEQKKLLSQASRTSLPTALKIDLKRAILDDEFSESLKERLCMRREEILEWPKRLANRVMSELDSGFDYTEHWEEKDLNKAIEEEERKQDLLDDLNRAARRVQLDPQILYDLQEAIQGKETVRDDTREWLKGFFKGAIPKIWTDRLVKFLKEI